MRDSGSNPEVVGNTTTVPAKPGWKSATLWIQVLSILIMGLGFVLEFRDVLEIDVKWVAAITIGVNLLTAIVRIFRTTQPVDFSPRASLVTLRTIDKDGDTKRVA